MILISCCLWDQLTESCLSQREPLFQTITPQFPQRNKWTSLLSSPQMQVKVVNQKASPMSKGRQGELKSGW